MEATGTLFGTMIGWQLAGPAGGLLGSFLGGWFHQSLPGVRDVSQEFLGSMAADGMKEASEKIRNSIKPLPTTYQNKLQDAVRECFQEAVADIASGACSMPGRQKREAPAEIVYLVSTLKRHDAALAEEVCQLFETVYGLGTRLYAASSATLPVSVPESYVSYQDLSAAWLVDQLDEILAPHSTLIDKLIAVDGMYDVRAHLKKHLYGRILWHFGYQLQKDAELYRVYSSAHQQALGSLVEGQGQQIREEIASLRPNLYQITSICKRLSADLIEKTDEISTQLTFILENVQQQQAELQRFREETQAKLDKLTIDLMEVDQVIEWIGPEEISTLPRRDNQLILGQRISVRHIRESRFMQRPKLLETLLEKLEIVVHESERQRETGYPKLYVLWINGRSGSGKSVLLLQLMQRLILERQAPVIWLNDNDAGVPEVLKRWPRYDVPVGKPVFLFLDDFFSAQAETKLDLTPVARLLETTNAHRQNWPIIVTCSPPENIVRFEATKPEKVEVSPLLIPLMSDEQQARFSDWYERYTGKEASTGPAFADDKGLVVSMTVELEHGDLAAFGKRFANRLAVDDLDETLAKYLALNRLYLWPPAVWLEADLSLKQHDSFNHFNADNDFTLEATGDARGFLRLTHPHLSDAIYLAIRTELYPSQRSQDLVDLFARALKEKPVLASLLLSAIAEDFSEKQVEIDNGLDEGNLQGRVSQFCPPDVLQTGLWQTWLNAQEDEISQQNRAWMWLHWATWQQNSESLDLLVTESQIDPIRQATLCLEVYHPQWGIIWQRLWALKPAHPDLLRVVVAWLKEQRHWNRSDWSHVWRALVAAEELPAEVDRSELLRAGASWLAGREERSDWSHVWQTLVAAEELPAEVERAGLLRAGASWLAGREERSEWNYVWGALVATEELPAGVERAELLRAGASWLAGREDRSDWNYVWGALVAAEELPAEVDRAELLRAGASWLAGREERSEWSHVWRALIATEELPADVDRAELLRAGASWLAGREERSDWAVVWGALVETKELPAEVERAELLRAGASWLAGREERSDWNYVWGALVAAEELPAEVERAELLRAGASWLAGRDERSDWSYVWRALVATEELPAEVERAELLRAGANWLAGREERSDWSHVWEVLVETEELPAEVDHAALLRAGASWLAGREERSDWNYVWQMLTAAEELPVEVERAALLRAGASWLAEREERSEWAHVWGTLAAAEELPAEVDRAELLRAGANWLAGREERSEWSHVWGALVAAEELPAEVDRAELLRAGANWLAGREERSEWSHVWRALVAAEELPAEVDRAELLRAGAIWLAGREERSEWAHVWEALVAAEELPAEVDRAELLRAGANWLAGREERSEWSHVWGALVAAEELPAEVDRAELLRAGANWLAGREERSEWSHVWRALVESEELLAEVDRTKLLRAGASWLAGREERSEWSYVWEVLVAAEELPANIEGVDLLRAGFIWLVERDDRSDWNNVWRSLALNAPAFSVSDRHILWRMGTAWLWHNQYNYEKEDWSYIYEAFFEVPSPIRFNFKEEYFRMGSRWVLKNVDRTEAYGIAEKILKYSRRTISWDKDDLLVEYLVSWLEHNLGNRSWGFVWEAVWDVVMTSELIEVFIKWLNYPGTRSKAVYWLVRNKAIASHEMISRLNAWVSASDASQPLWQSVQQGLKDGLVQ